MGLTGSGWSGAGDQGEMLPEEPAGRCADASGHPERGLSELVKNLKLNK